MRWLPVIFLLFTLLGTIIYSNSFSVPFHFDDIPNIIENKRIQSLDNFKDVSGSRYVGFLSFAINYHAGGLRVFGYHLVNLSIHIVNAILVYYLVLLLLRVADNSQDRAVRKSTPPSEKHGISMITALLFLVHPIQTQAVTYIVQRFASLAALFYLLSVILYLRWRMADAGDRKKILWYMAALGTTILAMKTKENSFTIPLIILLIEAVFFGLRTKRQWIALFPFILTLLIIPLSREDVLGEGEAGFVRQTTEISRGDYLLTQFRVVVTYIRLLILPIRQNLDYDFPIYQSFFEPAVLFSFLFLLLLFGSAVYLLMAGSRFWVRPYSPLPTPHSQLIAFGILWFFLTLSIESSIIPIKDVIFEHRLYLPSFGVFLAVSSGSLMGLGQSRFAKTGRRIAIGVLCILLLSYSIATYQRNNVWKNAFTLWMDVVNKAPGKARGHYNLGSAYSMRGSLQKAAEEYQEALAIQLDYPRAHFHLGNTYRKLGRLDDAIEEYQKETEIQPGFAMARNNLANVLADRKRYDEAILQYQAAVALTPNYDKAYSNMGTVLVTLGRIEEAMEKYRLAISLNPNSRMAHYNLGLLYQGRGQMEKAIEEYEIVIRIRPDDAAAYLNLGSIYSKKGDLSKTEDYFQEVIRLQPMHAEGHYHLGTVYARMGRKGEARQHFQKALELKPDLAAVRQELSSLDKKK